MQFEAHTSADDEHGSGTVFTVTDIADGKVVLDGNHPWAGKRLRFDCHVLDVRPATAKKSSTGTCTAPAPTTTDGQRLEQFPKLVQRGERVAGCHRVRVECRELRRDGSLPPRIAAALRDASSATPIGANRSRCGPRRAELVEAREVVASAADRGGRHAGKLRHLQPVAAIGGTVFGGVQEHDAVRVLDRVEVQIRAAFDLGRQRVSSK
jgi:hypothetical protein